MALSEYRIVVSRLDPIIYNQEMRVGADEFTPEFQAWMLENIGPMHMLHTLSGLATVDGKVFRADKPERGWGTLNHINDGWKEEIIFLHKEDAALFKIKWGGEIWHRGMLDE
jgi:hypothetical protein